MTTPDQFHSVFRSDATVQVSAPGRINLIGEHIDYLDGFVMPIAIDRHLTILAAPSPNGDFEIWTDRLSENGPVSFGLDSLRKSTVPGNEWLNYVIGVVSCYHDAGIPLTGFKAAIFSGIPGGAGLSSSAALETAVALVVEEISGVRKTPVERALLCQRAEHEFAGVPCGIMDQFAVGMCREGQVLEIDCRDLSTHQIPIPEGLSIVAADSGVKHALGDGEYRKRREDCEAAASLLGIESFRDITSQDVDGARELLGERLFSRARHAVTEMERVREFGEALRHNDSETLGRTMGESHLSLRDNFEVSCVELDFLVEAAGEFGVENGLVGARMTGGGFGGSTVNLVQSEAAEALKTYLEKAYREEFSRELNCFITKAVNGAQSLF